MWANVACQVRIPNCRGVHESWAYHGCIGNRLHLGWHSLRFRQTKPSVLLALVTVSSICFLQVKSSLMVTPSYLLLSTTSKVCPCTVELWSLELACFEHQRSLELVRRSRQFPYTFNVKIHPRLVQRWLELSNSKHGPQGDISCKNAMMARNEYS